MAKTNNTNKTSTSRKKSTRATSSKSAHKGRSTSSKPKPKTATSREIEQNEEQKVPAKRTGRRATPSRTTAPKRPTARKTTAASTRNSEKKSGTTRATAPKRTAARKTAAASTRNSEKKPGTARTTASKRPTVSKTAAAARNSEKKPGTTRRTTAPKAKQKPVNNPSQQRIKAVKPMPKEMPKMKVKEPQVENTLPPEEKIAIKLDQSVAILIDGNNIEISLHTVSKSSSSMINFDKLVPSLLNNRALSRLIYFREGKSISKKLADRLQKMFHGSVVPCYKSADIPLSIKAVQIASKVDTVIILSGDADYVELVRHLKHSGIRVEIAAFPETTAEILLNEADYFFPITVDYSFALK